MWKLCEILEKWNTPLKKPGAECGIPLVHPKTVQRWFERRNRPSPGTMGEVTRKIWDRFSEPGGEQLKEKLFSIARDVIPEAPVETWVDRDTFVSYFKELAEQEQRKSGMTRPGPPPGDEAPAPPIEPPGLTAELLQHLHFGKSVECINFIKRQSVSFPGIGKLSLPPNGDSLLTRAISLDADSHISNNNSRRELIHFLLKQSFVAVDQANEYGVTPLLRAASLHDMDAIRRLLDRGADVKATNIMNANVIYEAAFGASAGALAHIERFIGLGVDPGQVSHDGFFPLSVAIWRKCDIRTIEFLLAKARGLIDKPDHHGETPFFKAYKYRHYEALLRLIKEGAQPSAPADQIHRATNQLFGAAGSNDPEGVKKLLEDGDAVDGRGEFGRTPLHEAAENGSLEIAQILLAHGANPLACNNHGRTPRDLTFYRDTATYHELIKILHSAEQEAIKKLSLVK